MVLARREIGDNGPTSGISGAIGSFVIGRILSHCRILEKLGSGGMGDVYLAEDVRLGRKLALKVLAPKLVTDPGPRTPVRAGSTSGLGPMS